MNRILTAVVDAMFSPFQAVSPWIALAVFSLVTGVVMLLIFRLVSNQAGIRRAKARVVSELLVIRLFKDDPWMTVRGLGGALRANLGYLRHAVVPIAVMIGPVGLILVHLEPWFGSVPVRPGAATRVAVILDAPLGRPLPEIRLLPSGAGAYRGETPPLRIPSLSEVDWRVRIEGEGVSELRFAVGDRTITKDLVSGAGLHRVTAVRTGGGLLATLLHPGEPTLDPALGIREILVDYPARDFSALGVSMPWWLAFFILTLVFAFLLKKPLGVEA